MLGDIKKRFWKGSLTWIPCRGWNYFTQIYIRLRLFREFAVLDHVDDNPEHYIREGEYECGRQGCRELEGMGWTAWQARDISSFHNNWYFQKDWNKREKNGRNGFSELIEMVKQRLKKGVYNGI